MSSILVKTAAAGACALGVVALAQPPAQAGGAWLTPHQIEQAYSLPALYHEGITGSGTTIAIVDPYGSPTIAADLSTFDAEFGLPAASLTVIQPDGQVPPADASWAEETTLDVEYAHAIAPGARILLAETQDTSSDAAVAYILSNYHVDVISLSLSMAERGLPRATVEEMHSVYVRAEAQHVTVVASSGDTGAANTALDGVTYFSHPATQYPASDPLVTSVGGTDLHLDGDGNRVWPDTVWNDGGTTPQASGGGKSILFARPSYQDSVRSVVGNARGVPDISMSAACSAPVTVYHTFGGSAAGWSPACGTSEAAPMFAAVVALAAQRAGHSLGFINPALYRLAAQHASGIVPVTSGDNTVSFTQDGRQQTIQGYPAATHYSLSAGLGTIDAQSLVPELAAAAGTAPSATTPTATTSPPARTTLTDAAIPPATRALTSHSHLPA